MFQIERKQTPWHTNWYGNLGGDMIAKCREAYPDGIETREQAEQVAKELVAAVEQQWANTRSEHAGKTPLGVADLFQVVEVKGATVGAGA